MEQPDGCACYALHSVVVLRMLLCKQLHRIYDTSSLCHDQPLTRCKRIYMKTNVVVNIRALKLATSYCVGSLLCAVRAALLLLLRCRAAAACCCALLSVSRTLCELARITACKQ
jgi:hypothetical protein